jgi:glycosyltransferase involved in cell wall biosynthesis
MASGRNGFMAIKFSIIIPCYNAEKWIEECILSALSQTHKETEVIFIDNESTDNSHEVAKKVQREDSRLTVLSAPNLYKYSYEEPVEEGLTIASGEYFTILGADDFIEPTYIEKINQIISTSNGKIQILQTPIRGMKSDTGEIVGEIKHQYGSLKEFKQQLLHKSPVCTPSMVFKKSLHNDKTVQWNSEKYLGAVDYDLYCRLADQGHFIYPYPQWVGYYYRWHKDQATWGMHSEPTNYDQMIKDEWREKWKQELQ